MRICIFNWRDPAHPRAGGAEVYAHECARHWVAAGHDVTLFCAAVEGRPAIDERDGVRIVRRGSRFGVYREARRFWAAEGGRFDLVIDEVNTRPFGTPAFVDDVPLVALIHQVCREVWFHEMPLPVAVLGRFVLEPAWLRAYRDVPAMTLSESSRVSLHGYGIRRVEIVPKGVDVPPGFRLPPKEQVPTAVFVGRLSSNKRPGDALKAFAQVRVALPDAQLWVVGGGPLEERLRRRAPAGVRFLGRVDEARKFELLGRAHALVATSVREGWGLTVSEAAAVGTRSIGYRVGGLCDSIPICGGTVVDPEPAALAAGLVDALPRWAAEPTPLLPTGTVSWKEVADEVLLTSLRLAASSAAPR